MALDALIFRQQFERFKSRILRESRKKFVSFHEGLPDDWESYKGTLRAVARDRLGFAEWRSNDIGTGQILDRVIRSIEVSKRPDVPRNNLVDWQPRYGPKNQSHRALLAARADRSSRRRFEQWSFEFFRNELADQKAFDEFIAMAGRRYDLVAYLFFLKDWKRFMPIAPTKFDTAFSDLGVPVKTSRNCSWENYARYNAALLDIRDAFRDIAEIDARLIDAHSFCWILVSLKPYDRAPPRPIIPLPQALNNPRPVALVSSGPHSYRMALVVSEDDFLDRDAAQRRLGRLAEDIAFAAEQRRLQEGGRSDLARSIERVSDRPVLGYDILSFELSGSRRHIEAKATRRSRKRFAFFLTRNEFAQCRRLLNYYFYLVVDASSTKPLVFTVRASDISAKGLTAMTYLANLETTD